MVSNGTDKGTGTFPPKLRFHDHSYNGAPATDLVTLPADIPAPASLSPEYHVMRRSVLFSSTAALLLVSSSAFAQAKPNFAGKWTILPDSGAQQQGMPRGGAAMGGLGEEATITQDDKTFTVSRQGPNGLLSTTFSLDGSEGHQSIDVGNGNMIDLALVARWDGNKLATSTGFAIQGQAFEIGLVYSLDDKGNLVTVHTTPALGNNPGGVETTKYKKQ